MRTIALTRHHLLALVAMLALLSAPASAQLGGLIKRGAERAADKAVDKAMEKTAKPAPAPKFDEEVLELTPTRIDQVARGMKAWNEARAAADIPGAMKAFEASQKKEQDFAGRYSEQRQAYRQKNDDIEQCRDEVITAQHDANQAEIDKKMANITSDPARMQAITAKALEWNPKLQALMAGNDTVALRAAMVAYHKDMAKVSGLTLVVDSTKADTKCGKPAPKPSWLAAWDSTEVQTRKLGDRVREAETAGNAEAVAASGLTERQFAVARERVESFVKDGTMGFSRDERAALTPRKAELRALFPAT